MKLVRFTGDKTGIYVNPRNVLYIAPHYKEPKHTMIIFVDGTVYTVKESLETVKFELEDAPT